MLEQTELAMCRCWNFLQSLRKLLADNEDQTSRFLFFRAMKELEVLSRAIRAHRPFAVTDEWQALLSAVDFFKDCSDPVFSSPNWQTKFELQSDAFIAGSRE